MKRKKEVHQEMDDSKRSFIRRINDKCEGFRGIFTLISSLVPIITIIIWIFTAFAWLTASKRVSEVEDQLVNEKENINKMLYVQQLSDFKTNTDVSRSQSFTSLGSKEVVHRDKMLNVSEIIKYPRDCEYYWLSFVGSDYRVWPKVAIKNTGLPHQEFKKDLAIPAKFDKGKLIFACVPDGTHEEFRKWLNEGHDTPLVKEPSEFGIIFESIIEVASY